MGGSPQHKVELYLRFAMRCDDARGHVVLAEHTLARAVHVEETELVQPRVQTLAAHTDMMSA